MASLREMPNMMLLFVLVAIIGAAGALSLAEFQSTQEAPGCSAATNYTTCNFAYNITGNGLEGLDNSTSFLGVMGTIFAVVALIGLVVAGFVFKRSL